MARKSNNLAKTFIRSVVRQVGRDSGKVISNKMYGDAHSTPVRIVRNADTSPLSTDGGRRKYRHSLDRVVNGDLPATKAKAKKMIVTLENVFQEFIAENKTISSASELEYVLVWINKSEDYINDVTRIVSDEEVKVLAEEVSEGISSQRDQLVSAIDSIDTPQKPDLTFRRVMAWLILLLPYLTVILLDTDPEAENSILFLIWGASLFVTPFISYSMFKKIRAAKQEYKSKVNMMSAMKSFTVK